MLIEHWCQKAPVLTNRYMLAVLLIHVYYSFSMLIFRLFFFLHCMVPRLWMWTGFYFLSLVGGEQISSRKDFQGVDRDMIWMAGPSDGVGHIPNLYLLAQGPSIPDWQYGNADVFQLYIQDDLKHLAEDLSRAKTLPHLPMTWNRPDRPNHFYATRWVAAKQLVMNPLSVPSPMLLHSFLVLEVRGVR